MDLIFRHRRMVLAILIFLSGWFLLVCDSYAEERNSDGVEKFSNYIPYLVCVSDVAVINGRKQVFLNVKFSPNFGICIKVANALDDFIKEYRDIANKVRVTDSLLYNPLDHLAEADFVMFHPKVIRRELGESDYMFFNHHCLGRNASIGLAKSRGGKEWEIISVDIMKMHNGVSLTTPIPVNVRGKIFLIAESHFLPEFFVYDGPDIEHGVWKKTDVYIIGDEGKTLFKDYVKKAYMVTGKEQWRCGSVIQHNGDYFFYFVIARAGYSDIFVTKSTDCLYWSLPAKIEFKDSIGRYMPIVTKYKDGYIMFHIVWDKEGKWHSSYATSSDLIRWHDHGCIVVKGED